MRQQQQQRVGVGAFEGVGACHGGALRGVSGSSSSRDRERASSVGWSRERESRHGSSAVTLKTI